MSPTKEKRSDVLVHKKNERTISFGTTVGSNLSIRTKAGRKPRGFYNICMYSVHGHGCIQCLCNTGAEYLACESRYMRCGVEIPLICRIEPTSAECS